MSHYLGYYVLKCSIIVMSTLFSQGMLVMVLLYVCLLHFLVCIYEICSIIILYICWKWYVISSFDFEMQNPLSKCNKEGGES